MPSEVTALVGVAFLVAVGFGVVAPAIAPFAEQFGVSNAAASAVISAFALARLITAPFVGRLANSVGERLLLGIGIAIVAVSSALAGLSQQYWQLLLLRGFGGVGSIMFSVAAASLLYRVTPPDRRGQAQGVYQGGFLLGGVFGPALGVVASWSLRAPFFLYAATLAAAGTWALRSLRSSELAARAPAAAAAVSVSEALRRPQYRVALGATLATQWSVIGVRTALVPLFVVGPLALAAAWNYAAFFVVSVVSGALLLPIGRRADSGHRLSVVAAGLIAAGGGLLVLALVPALGGVLLAMVLLGISAAALSVAPGAIVGDVVGARGGTVVALFQMTGDLGAVAGPVVAGWVADRHGFGPAFALAAAVVVLPLALVAAAGPDRGGNAARPRDVTADA
ncbi:MAG: MFS transporter [bacterium]